MNGTQAVCRNCEFDVSQVVEERSSRAEAGGATDGGLTRSENPDMSNDKCG